MNITNENTQLPQELSYLRRHGIPILVASVLTCIVTLGVVLGIQRYTSQREVDVAKKQLEADKKRLEQALLGKWELVEFFGDGGKPDVRTNHAERDSREFRNDGTLKWNGFVVLDGNVQVNDKRGGIVAYELVDGEHIVINPDRDDWSKQKERVVVHDDELVITSSSGEYKYKRSR